jgi:hypothetical protein
VFAPDSTAFPGNVVSVLAEYFKNLDGDLMVTRRPVRTSDEVQTIGVFATDWDDNRDSQEMNGLLGQNIQPGMFPTDIPVLPGASMGTLGVYSITIQGLVTHTDEEEGIGAHSAMAKRIRVAVADDPNLRLALQPLTSSFGSKTERMQKWEVPRQRFLANEAEGTWIYLSVTELRITTETT